MGPGLAYKVLPAARENSAAKTYVSRMKLERIIAASVL